MEICSWGAFRMKADEKKCPRCAETIKKDAQACKHCGHEFSAEEMAAQKAAHARSAKNGAIGCSAVLVALLLIGMCSTAHKEKGKQASPGSSASSETSPQVAHAKYVEQLEREVKSLEDRSPLDTSRWTNKDAITTEIALIGVWSKLYADGANHPLDAKQRALRQRFKKLVSIEQQRRFPALRAAQAKILDTGMWESDVDVAALDGGKRRLRVTGGIFAANRNIKSGFEALQDTLQTLRFRRVEFEWYRGSERTYYDLTPLPDGQLATLDGAGWTKIE